MLAMLPCATIDSSRGKPTRMNVCSWQVVQPAPDLSRLSHYHHLTGTTIAPSFLTFCPPPQSQTQRKTEHNGSSDGVILFELVVQTNHLRRRWFQVLGSLLCPAGLSFSPEIDSSLLSYVSQSASERSFLFCGEKVRCPVLICTLLLFICTLERCTVYWLELCRPSHLSALQSSALLASHLHCGRPWWPAWSAAPSSLWSRAARRSWRFGANLALSLHCCLFF